MSPHKGSSLFISEISEDDIAKFNKIRSIIGRHYHFSYGFGIES